MSVSAAALFRATKAKPDRGPALPIELARQDAPKPLRRDADFYPTGQPEATRSLLHYDGDRIRDCGTVWENACGNGAMVNVMRSAGLTCYASDLHDRGCPDAWQWDFFEFKSSPARAIITNPPYDLINARDGHGRWLRHTLSLPGWDYLALLLSWDWPAARKNGHAALLDENPFSYCYLMRWKLDFTGEGSPPQRNAWFIWDRKWSGMTRQMRFMDKVDNRQPDLWGEGQS